MIRRSGTFIVLSAALFAVALTAHCDAFAQQVTGAYVDPQHLGTWIILKPGGAFDEMTPDFGLQGTYKTDGNLITFHHGGGGDAVAGPRVEGGSFQMRAEPNRLQQVEYPGAFVRIEHLPDVLAGEENGPCPKVPSQTAASALNRNERIAVGSLWTIQTALEIYFTIDPLHAPGLTSLGQLGPIPVGASSRSSHAGLLDGSLASGLRNGYRFVYVPGPKGAYGIPTYSVRADPVTPGVTGREHYYLDRSGVYHNVGRQAGPTDPQVPPPCPEGLAVSASSQQPQNAQQAPACSPTIENVVVPNACFGKFRHGTLVKKTGSGKNVDLEPAPSPAEATHIHPGVDLVADRGTPIYALADGLVVDVITDPSDQDFQYLGYMVRLKHAATKSGNASPSAPALRETETLYLHMQEPPLVKLGSVILANTQIGKIGQTGAAWGYHTHFEIRHFPGRYLVNSSWNDPPNIYGLAKTGAALLNQKWTDPALWFRQLPAELVPPAQFSVDVAVNPKVLNLPRLSSPFYDPGACPGEYCRYDSFTAQRPMPVHPQRGDNSVLFTLNKGQRVTAVTGIVITKPGKIRLLHPIQIPGVGTLAPQNDIYILTYRGEGYWKIWLQGKLIDSVQLTGRNFPLAIACGTRDQACKKKLETQFIGPIVGEVTEAPEAAWWIQIRDNTGRVGWVQASTITWAGVNGIF